MHGSALQRLISRSLLIENSLHREEPRVYYNCLRLNFAKPVAPAVQKAIVVLRSASPANPAPPHLRLRPIPCWCGRRHQPALGCSSAGAPRESFLAEGIIVGKSTSVRSPQNLPIGAIARRRRRGKRRQLFQLLVRRPDRRRVRRGDERNAILRLPADVALFSARLWVTAQQPLRHGSLRLVRQKI